MQYSYANLLRNQTLFELFFEFITVGMVSTLVRTLKIFRFWNGQELKSVDNDDWETKVFFFKTWLMRYSVYFLMLLLYYKFLLSHYGNLAEAERRRRSFQNLDKCETSEVSIYDGISWQISFRISIRQFFLPLVHRLWQVSDDKDFWQIFRHNSC